MTFSSKITALQNFLNSNYSSFTSTLTSTYNGDYANSIIYALRTIGKECRICIKTFLIPIVNNIYIYSILPSLYTKGKFDYVKAIKLNICSPVYSNEGLLYLNFKEDCYIDLTSIEDIESTNLDLIGISHKHIQNDSILKIVNGYYDTTPTYKGRGTISAVTSPNVIKILKTSCVATPVAGDIVYNLDAIDTNLQYSRDTILSVADGTTTWNLTMTNNVVLTTGNYKWVATDIITISTGEMSFIAITEQVTPTIDYLTASGDLSNEIPILNQLVDDIDPLCYKYLFGILTVRDPQKFSTIYATLLKIGLIKSEKEVITNIRAKLDTVDSAKVECYNIISNQYGR